MMPPKVESGDDLSSGQLLHDIEEISRALYVNKNLPEESHTLSNHQYKSRDDTRDAESISSVVLEDLPYKDKKLSIWKWKLLKALTHFRSQRFNCCFFLHVHAIEGLPPTFNDLSLCVNWKRKAEVMTTRPARVFKGLAEFEETLMHRCSVYGSKNGPQNSAKYEPKLFLLSASVVGAPTLDVGKHWVDLTRLLPLTLEELEEKKRTSGKWATSFKLKGKAKGAMINVSFCFSLLSDNSVGPFCFVKLPDNVKGNGVAALNHFEDSGRISTGDMLHQLENVGKISSGHFHGPSLSMDIGRIDESFPATGSELAHSVSFFYQKLEEEKLGNSDDSDLFPGHMEPLLSKSVHVSQLASEFNAYDYIELKGNDHRMELTLHKESILEEKATPNVDYSMVETIDVAEVFKDIASDWDASIDFQSELKVHSGSIDEKGIDDNKLAENDIYGEELTVEELESVSGNFLSSDSAAFSFSLDTGKSARQESYVNRTPSFREGKMVRTRSLDDLTESVANDFLNMLGIEQSPQYVNFDSGPESPREILLQQFEEESIISGNSLFDFNTTRKDRMDFGDIASTCHGKLACYDDFDLPLVFHEAANEKRRATESLRSRRNLELVENLETESLMKKWGLDENDFHNSPRITSGGFGSPVYYPDEVPSGLPPLGEGFGPRVPIEDGGFLQSMNPLLFRKAKNGARLVIQVSRSVVLPAAIGSSAMQIFECWASEGVDKMCCQANELMPLQDITGKKIQQIQWERECGSQELQRLTLPCESVVMHDFHVKQEKDDNLQLQLDSVNSIPSSVSMGVDRDYVSLKDLETLIMEKIEVLSLEGLKIQSSMAEKEAPSSIIPHSYRDLISGVSGFRSSEDSERLQILDIVGDVDAIVKLSLPLDKWIKLDSGDFAPDEEINDQILKILAVHHAKSINLRSRQVGTDCEQVNLLRRRDGILGNRFMLALRLQLRDPFRNYEMVGASMLALIQVERLCIPMQEEDFDTMSRRTSNEEDGNLKERRREVHDIPMFKIIEFHVAGWNVDSSDKLTCISRRQQQTGIRWLLSSGMGKIKKLPVSKSKEIIISSTPVNNNVLLRDILWSISSDFQGAAAKDKDFFAAENLYLRNPDIVFPKESSRIPSPRNLGVLVL